ncbi:MAG: type IV toxin-antitoxin system AbiEi family antitoxin domain-containing protein [Nitriliruptoraceae bacterium]
MTYRRTLFEHALDNHGLITTADADRLGVPTVELSKLVRRGALEHVSYGVYRHVDVLKTPLAEFAEAVARVGRGAYLVQDAVLALHGLAQVNPRSLRVATRKRVRRDLPPWIELVSGADDDDVTEFEGIAATTVATALKGCVGIVPRDQLHDALEEGRRRGLVRRRDVRILADVLDGKVPA